MKLKNCYKTQDFLGDDCHNPELLMLRQLLW